jgi:trehalose 6-phosphate phosphatase
VQRPRVRIRRLPTPPSWLDPKGLAIFLDLDGTLVDIAEHPERIVVNATLREMLARLQQACGGAVALVSGRSIAGIDRHLAPLALPVAGQHGLERRTAAGICIELAGRELLPPVRQALDALLDNLAGVLVEDKGMALAVHYRQRPVLASWLHRSLRQLVAARPGLALLRGKRVVEIKPAGADKGRAIADFLAEAPYHGRRPVFVGDDITDEAGFAAVNAAGGITVKVGAGSTAANHRLPDVEAVLDWLNGITKGNP